MNTESFRALRRANPRTRADFERSRAAAADAVRARIAHDEPVAAAGPPRRPRRRRAQVSAAAGSLAAAALAAAFLTTGVPGGGSGVESAQAAVERAASTTADTAENSGTAVVRMTHGGQPWAGKTVVWNGSDIAISREETEGPRKPGSGLLVVDNVLYGIEPRLGWVRFGDPSHIDPDSGTTPAEMLAAIRADVGGPTLRRITGGMSDLTSRSLTDGSTVYSGTVAAGVAAPETGAKDGETLRVLPFGYVANDEAANAGAPLNASITVGADGVIREIALAWGTWTYAVTYSGLGTTAAPEAPKDAVSILKLRAVDHP
jgi:hypothetical protein